MRSYKSYCPGQSYLLPPDVNDWLSSGHFARFVLLLVRENLDLSLIKRAYDGKDGRGAPPYDPGMMISLLIYAYSIGTRSSRRIEELTKDDLGARLLTANQHPDHDSIAHFRRRHKAIFLSLFRQSLLLCAEAGLIKLGDIDLYVDGTKMLANASGQKTVSYARVCKTQRQLQEVVDRILGEAEAQDAAEDELYGVGKSGGAVVPADFQDPEKARELLRQARERLAHASQARTDMENSARAEAEQTVREAKAKREEHEKAKKRGRKPVVPDVDDLSLKLCAQKRVNLTDPDSRLMQDGATKSIVQAYNCQIVTTAQSLIIVAYDATSEENDIGQLAPMAQRATQNLDQIGADPAARRRLGADAGYLSVAGVNDPRATPFDLYIAPGRDPRREADVNALSDKEEPDQSHRTEMSGGIQWYAPPEPTPTPAAALRQEMKDKIATEEGRQFYNHRSSGVEPVFAETKETRGIRRLLLRGNENANAEWGLICFTHNIRKLFRHRQKEAPEQTKRTQTRVESPDSDTRKANSYQLALGMG